MLVVLEGAPGAAPGEAVLEEEPVAEVAGFYLISERARAVGIGLAVGGLYVLGAVLTVAHVGIIAGVDVDGEATGVIGELLRVGHVAVAEAAGVVVAHLSLVVGIVVVGQPDALDGVVVGVELAEDGNEFVGNELVADELALVRTVVVVPVEHTEVSEIGAGDMGILDVGLALHAEPDGVGDLQRDEVLCGGVLRQKNKRTY